MNIALPVGKTCEAPGCGKPATKTLLDRRRSKLVYCCNEHYELVNEAARILKEGR